MSEFVKVAKTDELAPGKGKIVHAGGQAIALFHIEGSAGTFYAICNTCPHKGGSLGEGTLEGHTVTCPRHGWDFDLRTGETSYDLLVQKTYRVRVEGDDVMVEL